MYFLSLNWHSSQAHVFIFPNSTFVSSQLWLLCIVYLEKNCVCLISVLFFKKRSGDNYIRVLGQEHAQWNYNQAWQTNSCSCTVFLVKSYGLIFSNWSDLCLFRWWYRELEETAFCYEVSSNVHQLLLSGIILDKFIFWMLQPKGKEVVEWKLLNYMHGLLSSHCRRKWWLAHAYWTF